MTGRVTAEGLRAQSMDFLRATLDSQVIMSITDVRGTITEVSQAFCDISGYSREELLGQNHRILNAGRHPPEFWREMWKTVARGDAWRGEVCNRAKDASLYWVDSTIVATRGPNGRIESYISLRIDITERRKREQRDAAMRQRFDRAVTGTLEGLWDYVPGSDSVWFSDQFMSLLGLDLDAASQSSEGLEALLSRIDPKDRDAVTSRLRDGGAIDSEVRIRVRDGYRWFRLRARARRDVHGVIECLSGSISDIHDRHRMQARMELATRSAHIGTWDWDVPSGEAFFNDTYFEMLGYKPGELAMGLATWQDLLHPDDLPEAKLHIERHFEGETSRYAFEHRLRHKDGHYRWIRALGEVVEWQADGSPKRMMGVHVDIDDSKCLGLALRSAVELESHENEAETLTQLCVAVATAFRVAFAGVARIETRITDGKREGWARMIAASCDGEAVDAFEYRLAGTPCADAVEDKFCVHPSGVADAYPEDKLLADMGFESYAGLRLCNRRGEVIGILVMLDRQPLRASFDLQSTLQVFGTRATAEIERINHERSLRKARDAAEEANRAKSEFLANMSHEIRTPMTAILGFADLLVGDLAQDPDAQREAVHTIQSNANHLLTIVNDILDVSKIEAGQMQIESIDIDPLELLRDTTALIGARAQSKSLELRIVVETPVPARIQTDPTRLRQILLNLTGNAIKFTARGSVTLFVRYDAADATLAVRVVDTGVGMDASQVEKIGRFVAFAQADTSTTRRFGGTGLGLRISNSLARMLGGRIDIASQEGVGTEVTLTVAAGKRSSVRCISVVDAMRALEPSKPSAPEPANEELEPLMGLRILLVEDGPDNQRLITFQLMKAGARVDVRENGRLAVDYLEGLDDGAEPDLILMDMQMPELDGYEATRILRARGCRVPILALTANAMDGDRVKCLAAGCDDYLSKPVAKKALIAAVREACSGAARGARTLTSS